VFITYSNQKLKIANPKGTALCLFLSDIFQLLFTNRYNSKILSISANLFKKNSEKISSNSLPMELCKIGAFSNRNNQANKNEVTNLKPLLKLKKA
jgi:hypothetical protein